MILPHTPALPRYHSGADRRGVPWTVLEFPRDYGRFVASLEPPKRRKALRGLLREFERTTGLPYGHEQ